MIAWDDEKPRRRTGIDVVTRGAQIQAYLLIGPRGICAPQKGIAHEEFVLFATAGKITGEDNAGGNWLRLSIRENMIGSQRQGTRHRITVRVQPLNKWQESQPSFEPGFMGDKPIPEMKIRDMEESRDRFATRANFHG